MLTIDIKEKSSSIFLRGVLICIVLGHSCCTRIPASLPPVNYVTWLGNPANGLHISKDIGDITFSIQYQPAELMVANKEKDPYLKTSVLQQEVNKYKDFEYYTLRIANNRSNKDVMAYKIQNPNEYYDREKYYSYDFENDIYMVSDGDTLPCSLFNYAPNYGIAPHIDFLIAFQKKKSELQNALNDHLLVVEDKVFGNGTLKFEIKKGNINNIPSLITY